VERHFERELQELKERLLWMASLTERAVHQSVRALLEGDGALARQVIEEENAVNEMQIEIDERALQLLALHQLMATDLRFVLAVSRINADLERIVRSSTATSSWPNPSSTATTRSTVSAIRPSAPCSPT
jgi:phosphate transport system protein